MTLYVRALVDENGTPFDLAVEPVSHTAAAALSVVSELSASASLSRFAAAALSTSVTVTATATVTAATDLSSLLVAGAGTYGPGSITIPGYDQPYKVTVSNANIVGYNGTDVTPGIGVTLPAPSTPNSTHWITIRWEISGTQRRVFHDIQSANWLTNGDVIEPSVAPGSVATLTYTWDTAAHGWYVSSASGDVLTRTHGPDESSTDLPLYFTPECRALGAFSTIKAAHIATLAELPTLVPTYLGSIGEFVEITSDSGSAYVYGSQSGPMYEPMHSREIFDPTWASGIFGRYGPPSIMAYPWMSGEPVDGRVMLHEIGHSWDAWGLSAAGTPYGVAPRDNYSPNAYDSITYTGDPFDYFGFTIVEVRYDFEPTRYMYTLIADDDTEFPSSWIVRTPARFQEEQAIVDLYASVADKPGSYYRSSMTEWVAQCFMLCWADHVTGYDPTAHATLVTEVGGSTIFEDFRDYAVTVGVLPSSW